MFRCRFWAKRPGKSNKSMMVGHLRRKGRQGTQLTAQGVRERPVEPLAAAGHHNARRPDRGVSGLRQRCRLVDQAPQPFGIIFHIADNGTGTAPATTQS